MAGSSIFVTYGLKSGGGPAFLKRTREAVSQLQTRTRVSSATFQLQRQYCSNNMQGNCIGWHGWTNVSETRAGFFNGWYTNPRHRNLLTSCSFGAWSNWTDTGGCTAATPDCTGNNLTRRECRTDWRFIENWSAFEEVDICVSTNPTPNSGVIQTECTPT